MDEDIAFKIGMALGNAYGNMWAANAKGRQERKADDIIEQMQNERRTGQIAALSDAEAARRNANTENNQLVNSLAPKQPYTQNANGSYSLNLEPLQITKYGDTTPESRAINNILQDNVTANRRYNEQMASLTPEQRAAAEWNPNYTESNVRRALKKAGLNQEVIDSKVAEAKKDIAERAKSIYMPTIMQSMYGSYTTDANGNQVYKAPDQLDYMRGTMAALELSKYDPDTAKMFLQNGVSPRDLYQANRQDAVYNQKMQDRRVERQQDYQNRLNLVNARGGNGGSRSGSGSNKYSISTSDYQAALKRKGEIEAYYEEQRDGNPNYELPKSMREEYNELDDIAGRYRQERRSQTAEQNAGASYEDNGSDTQAVDWNNWDSLTAGIDQALRDGYSSEEILALAESRLGKDHPWYQNIASSFDHAKSAREAELQAQEEERLRQERLYNILHPGTGSTNTTDQTIARIAELGSNLASGRPVWNIAHR